MESRILSSEMSDYFTQRFIDESIEENTKVLSIALTTLMSTVQHLSDQGTALKLRAAFDEMTDAIWAAQIGK